MAVSTASGIHVREESSIWTANDWGIFIVRLVLGIIFFMHGSQKVFGWFGGHTLAASAAGMEHMGIMLPLAYLSIFTELIGGILCIIGLFTRLAGIGLFIDMIVAVAMVHFKNGFFIMGGPGPGYEFNVALIAMSLAVAVAGPGALRFADWEGALLVKMGFRQKA